MSELALPKVDQSTILNRDKIVNKLKRIIKSENVLIAMQSTDVSSMDEGELDEILDKIIQNNMDLVKERGEHAVVTLMGIAMKEVRGKASGKMVNDLLRKKVSEL